MEETIRVRDHSRTCEHGRLWQHWFEVTKAGWWQEPDCLGGKEMVLRRVEGSLWEEIEGDDQEA